MRRFQVLSLCASVLAGSALIASSTLAQTTPAQTAPQNTPPVGAGQGSEAAASLSDVEFVTKAVAGNRYEIEAARIAVAKATGPKVKDFAGMLAKDHSEILGDLGKSAKEAGVAMPAEFVPDASQQARLDALKARSEAQFDAAFTADMKKAHDDSLALLKLYLQTGKSPKLQAWAAKWLPTVQKHRDMLKEM